MLKRSNYRPGESRNRSGTTGMLFCREQRYCVSTDLTFCNPTDSHRCKTGKQRISHETGFCNPTDSHRCKTEKSTLTKVLFFCNPTDVHGIKTRYVVSIKNYLHRCK